MNTQFRRAGGYNASLSYRMPDAEQRARQARLRQYQSGRRSSSTSWVTMATLLSLWLWWMG
jgi:hypothetical protein